MTAALLVAVVSVLLAFSGFFQWWHDWGSSNGLFVSNGMPSTLVGLVMGLGWFSYRRWHMAGENAAAQVRAERETLAQHRQFMDAFESLPIGIAFFDREDKLAFCNSQYVRMNPIEGAILMGRTFEENLRHWVALGLYPEAEGREENWVAARLDRHRRVGGSFEYEREMAGRNLWVHEHRTPDGGSLIIVDDVTDRKEMGDALHRSEARLRAILDNSPASIYLKDVEARFLLVNREFERRNSVSAKEVIGRTSHDFLPRETADLILAEEDRVIENRVAMTFERTLEYRNGTTGSFLAVKFPVFGEDGTVIGLGSISADISERKEMENRARELQAELAHVSRLSTMGELAAGFAHELNQPLAAINNYVTGVLRRLKTVEGDYPDFVPVLEKISEQAQRGGEIIRNIRGFIRKDHAAKAPMDVNAAITTAVDMLVGELALNQIQLRQDISPAVPRVFGNAVEIQQVILNLLRNAIDAVLGSDAPRHITVRTNADGVSGVRISVEDSGTGISSEVRRHLFEPFFTTKTEGLGMGLLICRTIIEEHGGELEIVPGPDGGTRASFRLAAAIGAEAAENRRGISDEKGNGYRNGPESD